MKSLLIVALVAVTACGRSNSAAATSDSTYTQDTVRSDSVQKDSATQKDTVQAPAKSHKKGGKKS